MMQLASVISSKRLPLVDKASEDDDVDMLLRAGRLLRPGHIEQVHVLIVADHGFGLLRGLLRRGCLAATCMRPSARPEAAAFELAFFPDVTPETCPERLVHDARRALVPGGRLVARVRFDPAGGITRRLGRRLKLNGFIKVRTTIMPEWILLRADLPVARAAGDLATSHHAPVTNAVEARRRPA